MGLLDFIKTGPIKMTQENQKMLFAEFCENTEEFMLPAKDITEGFSCNFTDTGDKVVIEILAENNTYSFEVLKSEDGYKFLKNFFDALTYLNDLKEAYFVSHTASPVAEINVISDKENNITFSLLLKKSMVLKQDLVNIKMSREMFEKEFYSKIKTIF